MFFKNTINESEDLIKVAALLVHAAKIDENYSETENQIIRKALLEVGANNQNIDKILVDAKKIEESSNQILEFTKEVKNKSFDEIFPKKWVKKIINTEIDCDSIGWRGFMISNGLIWFDRMESGKWTIKSINGVNQEDFDNKDLIGWKTNKGIIPPSCFPTFGYFEKPKVDLFTEEFGIKNKRKFKW